MHINKCLDELLNIKDTLPLELISVIYDSDLGIAPHIIRDLYFPKEISDRVSIFDYKNAPIFEGKSFPFNKVLRGFENENGDKTEEVKRELEMLQKNYGLTKSEETAYKRIKKILLFSKS